MLFARVEARGLRDGQGRSSGGTQLQRRLPGSPVDVEVKRCHRLETRFAMEGEAGVWQAVSRSNRARDRSCFMKGWTGNGGVCDLTPEKWT